jgi:serine/threonine protein kinase
LLIRTAWSFAEAVVAAADQLGHSPAAQVRLLRQWGAAVGRTRALAGLNSYCAATPAYPAHLRDELREHFDELFDVSDGATRHGLVAGVIVPTAVGPLTVGERVGSGGLGVVYAAHGAHGERYALKVLSDHRFELTPSVRQRFAREARVARGLEHANLVRTFDYLEIDGAAGIVLEYMGGGTLEQRLQRGRPTADEGRRWMLDLARGLACLHAAGVVHRDISARNVLFRDDATAALCDLGVARTTDDTQITVAGEQFGSLIYISPQQRRAPHEAEPRDDVYSLGLVFQYIATGVNPHAVRSPRGRTDHDDAIIELVEAMTVYDRDARPTAAEVVRWLEHPVPEDAALAVRFARALDRVRASRCASCSTPSRRRWPSGRAGASLSSAPSVSHGSESGRTSLVGPSKNGAVASRSARCSLPLRTAARTPCTGCFACSTPA